MGTLIDTSVFIAMEKGQLDAAGLLSRHPDAIALSVITASELLHGVERTIQPLRRAKRERFVKGVLDLVPTISIDLEIARTHARLSAHLAAVGTPIGVHDGWIAATALTLDYAVATRNLREFERVDGLRVEAW